ncbi:XylR family transcriptional regulator [Gemmata sp.]|uniref:XylR family transcriptional regulator n=1 Tax=Gemmata sp. TaxID=1914242 RepID=UPI003F72585F
MRRVALLIETSREYGRGLLRGVTRYQRERGPWSLYFEPKGLRELPAAWLGDWDGDGILVRADDRALADAVVRSGIPAVELRFTFTDLPLHSVGIDNAAVVDLAVGHLLECGFRSFAYCGLPPGENAWADYRGEQFLARVRRTGAAGAAYPYPPGHRGRGWERDQQSLAAWLAGLPRPVGVMACNDDRGLQVLDACRRTGLRVPDEVAVVGVDNDEFLCNLSTPPLSSVDVGVERAGYAAAELLERLMAGEGGPPGPVFLPPIGVVVRRSTEVVATADADLARAIRYVRENACTGLRVADVLRQCGRSQSTLQRQFRAVLGRTPKAEIVRVQVERAKQLLASTDLSVGGVAERCGFSHVKRLCGVFRGQTGQSPGQFRKAVRSAGTGADS